MFKPIVKFIKWVHYWLDYWDIKPNRDIVGLFVALGLVACLFFLPSFDPGFSMTPEKFASLCEKNGYEMVDDTAAYYPRNVVSTVSSTDEDCVLKFVSCPHTCFSRYYMADFLTQMRRTTGGMERHIYNSEFNLTRITSMDRVSIAYRNGTELILISMPDSELETMEKIMKKSGIPPLV